MKLRSILALCALVLAGMFALAPLGVAKAAELENPFKNIPVSGSTAGGGSFKGSFTVKEFAEQNGQIVAVGNLKGQLTEGSFKGKVNEEVALPVTFPGASAGSTLAAPGGIQAFQAAGCEILDLQLGPLDLTLLGLNVFLDEVNLEITAIPGGGLLGDLLCAVNNLLNNPLSLLGQIVDALNDLLDFFNNL